MAMGDFFSRLATTLRSSGPNTAAAPEDDVSPPLTDQIVIAHDPSTLIVPDKYLSTIKANDDTILRREGSQDLKLFEALLDDDVAMSTFQQRRLAVISCETEVAPGDEKDPRSVEAADHLRAQLKAIAWDRITDRMLYSVWFGYGVGEPLYTVGEDGKICLKDIVVPDRKWFAFTVEGELRFAANLLAIGGEVLPPNKFWVIRSGGTHDFAFYGLGLAHWVYWPVWFKRAAMRFWALYLEKMGRPTTLAAYDPTGTKEDKDTIMAAAEAAGSQSAITVPEALFDKFKIIESTRSGAGTSSFSDFIGEQNDATTRIVLGSPGMSRPTAGGIGSGQADKEQGVKQEIVKADADLVCESFNGTVAVWLTRWNYGPGVKPPRVYRVIEEAESIDAIAERDSKLDAIGIKRTEQSVAEVYGPGYELDRPEPVPVDPATGLPIAQRLLPAPNDETDPNEIEFTARDLDAIESLTRKLSEEGEPVFAAIAEMIRGDLEGVTTLEGARVAMLQTFERLPYEKLAELTSLPFLATRAGALAGAEDAVKP